MVSPFARLLVLGLAVAALTVIPRPAHAESLPEGAPSSRFT
jgi:hypothetical protein